MSTASGDHTRALKATVGGAALDRAIDEVSDGAAALRGHVHDAIEEVKPRLRGWLHATVAPLTLVAGVVLVVLSPTPATRIGSAIFALSSVVLFTASATMHVGRWSPRTNTLLTRLDRSCIFVLIAGSYTPFALLLLAGSARTTLLTLAWGGAAAGIAFRILWTSAPRWVFLPLYIGLGWAAVFFADDFVRNGSAWVVGLIAAGGLLYTIGGVVYGFRKPNPFPQWFGFHEIFHVFTVAAFAAHYAGVSVATYALR